MSKFEVHPLSAAHLREIDMRTEERMFFSDAVLASPNLDILVAHTWGQTLICEGDIVCCFGWKEVRHGTVEYWMVPSKDYRIYSMRVARTVKAAVDNVVLPPHIKRIQLVSDVDDIRARFCKFLGFEYEGLLRNYSYFGENQLMWSKIRE